MLSTPEAVHKAWQAAYNVGDVDGMMAALAPTPMLVTEPGTAVTGADVRTAMQAMVDRGVPLTMTARHLYVNEDHGVALVIADWTMRGTASDGEEVDQSGSASDVLMLINGEWRCVIDNPIGSAQ